MDVDRTAKMWLTPSVIHSSGCYTHMRHSLARRNAVLDCNVLPISSVLDPHRAANLPCREHQIAELLFREVVHPRDYPLPRTIRELKMSE